MTTDIDGHRECTPATAFALQLLFDEITLDNGHNIQN